MTGIRSGGLRPRHAVVLLALATGTALTVLVTYDHYRDYVAEIEAAGLKTRNLSRLLEEHARQSLHRVELSMVRAAEAANGAGGVSSADPDALRERLRALLPPDGLIRFFALLDRDGAAVLSTQAEDIRGVRVAGRDYFVAQRERAGLGIVIGAAVKSRITGLWTLPVSVRLDAPGGAFQGVLLAMVEPAYFQAFYDSIDTGSNGFVTLFQRQGRIIVRSPLNEEMLSHDWAGSPMFRLHLPEAQARTVRQFIAATGTESIYSYRALRDYPVVVSFGVSLTDILARWRERTWRDGTFLLIVLGALGGAALALNRQLRRREATEMALRESEQQTRLFMEVTADCLWNWDLITGKVVRSIGFNRIFEYSAQEMDSSITWWEERLHPDDRGKVLSTYQDTVASGGNSCSYEYQFRRNNGTYAAISDHAYIVRDAKGKPVRALGAMTDITERKHAEVVLRNYANRLMKLSRQVLTAQENERRLLARELHDEIGQALTAVKLNLQSLGGTSPAARAAAADSLEALNTAIDQVRSLSLDLRPQILDDLGIVAALRWYCRRTAERSGLHVTFQSDAVHLAHAEMLATVCYRITQEAVTNALRHAHAKNVRVELRAQDGRLRLSIDDDGAGMDLATQHAAAHAGGSSGLLSMEERAALAGGRLQLFSQPGRGTCIVAEFLHEEAHAAA